MKKIVRHSMVAAAVLLAASCTHELKTRTFVLEDSVPAEGIDASCEVSCSFEYVTGGVSREVMDKINATIISHHLLFDEAGGSTDVPAACEQWVASMTEGYNADIEDFGENLTGESAWMFNFEYGQTGQFAGACKSRHLQTYSVSYNEYTGGAHGLYGVSHDVYDLSSGEILPEADLFAAGYEEGVSELLERAMEDYLSAEDLDAEALFGRPEPNGNFAVSEEGVTWTYNPYEIAPYALGAIDLTLSWSELKPYLK